MTKILVVEDKEEHLSGLDIMRKSGLEITVARDFISAAKFLNQGKGPVDYEAVLTDLMMPFGGIRPLGPGIGKEEYLVGFAPEGEKLRRTEQALGYGVAFCAAKLGVPLIGILTDMDHHSGPVAGTFDLLYSLSDDGILSENVYGSAPMKRPIFRVNNSRLAMLDSRDVKSLYLNPDGSLVDGASRSEEAKKIKNWQAFYTMLKEAQKPIDKYINLKNI